jgi:hypothetical protein
MQLRLTRETEKQLRKLHEEWLGAFSVGSCTGIGNLALQDGIPMLRARLIEAKKKSPYNYKPKER